jgi:hypothetical protein
MEQLLADLDRAQAPARTFRAGRQAALRKVEQEIRGYERQLAKGAPWRLLDEPLTRAKAPRRPLPHVTWRFPSASAARASWMR